MDKNKFENIIDGWLDFALRESIAATTLDLPTINEHLNISIEEAREDDDGIIMTLSESSLALIKKEFNKKSEGSEADIFLFFPIIQHVVQNKKVGLPLFALKINDQKSRITKNNNIHLNPFEGTEVHIMKDVFQNELGLPEEELPGERNLLDFMNSLSQTTTSSFKEAYDSFCDYIQTLTKFQVNNIGIVQDGKITYEYSMFSKQMKLIKETGINFSPLAQSYLEKTEENVLDETLERWYGSFNGEYALGIGQAKVLSTKPNNWVIPVEGAPGTGKTTLMLSTIAQHITSRAINHIWSDKEEGVGDNSLIVVVSSANKAVENVEEDLANDPFLKNRNDLFLFLGNNEKMSLATKRVNAFIENFKNEEPDLKKKKLIEKEMGELIQSMEQTYQKTQQVGEVLEKSSEIVDKVNKLKEQMEVLQKRMEDIDLLDKIKQMDVESLIRLRSKQINLNEVKKEEVQEKKSLALHKKVIINIDKKIETKDIQLSRIAEESDYLYFSLAEIEEELINIKKREILRKEYEDTPLYIWSIDGASKVQLSIEELKSSLSNIPFWKVEFLFQNRSKMMKGFWSENKTYLSRIGFTERMIGIDKIDGILEFLNEIAKLKTDPIYKIILQDDSPTEIQKIRDIRNLKREIEVYKKTKATNEVKILNCEDKIRRVEQKLQDQGHMDVSEEQIEQLVDIKTRLDKITTEKEELKLDSYELEEVDSEQFEDGDVFELCRRKHVAENRKLFDLALGYLEQIRLENKAEVMLALKSLKIMVEGNMTEIGAVRSEWSGRVERFYALISLVFPIFTSTIASFHKLTNTFHGGFLNNNGKWISWNKYETPPISLLLSDESGMTKVHSLFPALYYSKQAVIVGDENQLEPIVSISEQEIQENVLEFFEEGRGGAMYSPGYVSAYGRAAGRTSLLEKTSMGILLDEHRRCQPNIAAIFKEIVGEPYKDIKIKTPELKGERLLKVGNMGGTNNILYNVIGNLTGNNVNRSEINAIEGILDELEEAGYDLTKEVGIITPYKGQAKALINKYQQRLDHSNYAGGSKKIGTVHSFQGVEFEVIIISTVITGSKTAQFLNNKNSMLNVSISRAKDILIVVGDSKKLISSGGNTATLVEKTIEYGIQK